MNDPKRLLDDPTLSSAEVHVLQAAIQDEPPATLRGALWTSLAHALPADAMGPAASSDPSPDPGLETIGTSSATGSAAGGSVGVTGVAAAAGVGALAKAAGLGVGLGLLAVVGHGLVSTPAARPPTLQVASVAATAAFSVPAETQVARHEGPIPESQRRHNEPSPALSGTSIRLTAGPPELPASETSPPQAQAPSGPPALPGMAPPIAADPASQERRRQAQEESLLVATARMQLRAGNAAGALSTLRQADSRFPAGILGQEREAIAIEALAASGQQEQAARRAKEFLASHPSSPHTSRVRAFLSQ